MKEKSRSQRKRDSNSSEASLYLMIRAQFIWRLSSFVQEDFTGREPGTTVEYENFQEYVHRGFLPRIYDKKQRPLQAYSNYYKTYVERDVRQILNLKDQNVFETFIRLLAGRVGRILNYNSLANDVGVSAKTIRNWLSILEASFIVYKLPPYFENFGKRVIKSAKYYFTEVGLLSFLLGIRKTDQVVRDPLVGHIFENLVVMEFLKIQLNKGHLPALWFFQDSNGNGIDLLAQTGRALKCFEIKSSSTYPPSMTKNLNKIKQMNPNIQKVGLVYNGPSRKLSNNTELINFKKIEGKL